jgi:hypothetical protein
MPALRGCLAYENVLKCTGMPDVHVPKIKAARLLCSALVLMACRGALGTAHVYPLADLLAAARAKHGSVHGMAAEGRAKAARAEQRRRGVQDAAARRRQALQEALAPLGAELRWACWACCGLSMDMRGRPGREWLPGAVQADMASGIAASDSIVIQG